MGAFVCIFFGLLVYWLISKLRSEPDGSSEEGGDLRAPRPSPSLPEREEAPRSGAFPAVRRRAFDLYEDAASESGRFDASHEAFSSSRFPHKQASMVTGLTFEDDRIYVLRGQGVTIFPFVPSLTLAVVAGRTEGFKETTPYSMTLASEVQGDSARFPLEFPGWLEVLHQAREAGVVIELDASLPERLKEFITAPTVDDGLPPIVIRPGKPEVSAPRPSKCRACGASFGRKVTCDFCGTSQ
jgi:hypothetical protein